MTVLQVVPSLDTGGAERTTIDIAAELVRGGSRALVASEGGRLEAELAAAGGELVRLPAGSKNPVIMAGNALRLARLIRSERVDLVHARSRAPAWSALAACHATGTPFLTTYHGVYAERGAAKRFYNSVMTRGKMVIANSSYTAGLIAQRYGTPAERIAVIHRGADLVDYRPAAVDEARRDALRRTWNLTGREKIVLNVARLTNWKGQSVLIEAATLPPLSGHADLVIVLAGDAQGRKSYRQELEGLIAGQNLAGRVKIVGHCPDVPAALALADVAVVASTEPEAFGRFAVEAEAMGVPVVATAIGAAPETVLAPPHVAEADRTGWLVPPKDAASLAAAIGTALALSPDERAELSQRARAHAERFSTGAMQEATLALYGKMLSQRRNGGKS